MSSPRGFPDCTSVLLQNVSVRYRVPSERFVSFKDYAIRYLQGRVEKKDFWALNKVNLEISLGEVIGIIGHNGAGKSTLLKLIARVLTPTSGRVVVRGSIAPLLELGAGFHHELSGRDNIFLYGAILGFSYQQIKEKQNRIIEFSDLQDFIDSPLRTYSSGMMARLAFSVATDERPDILLVDEVLAVGDEEFQRKCSHRIAKYRDQGATIIIVAHSMDLIRTICERAALLDHGRLIEVGKPDKIINTYRNHQHQE